MSRDRFEVVQNICSKTQLKKAFGFLQFHLSRFAAGDQAAKARPAMALANIQAHLKSLYEMLVRPVEGLLSEKKSLIVVPSDFLHYVPFHALFDGSAYLVDRFTISYAPTATIYRLFVERPVEHKTEALLIGVPDEAAPLIADEIEKHPLRPAGLQSICRQRRHQRATDAGDGNSRNDSHRQSRDFPSRTIRCSAHSSSTTAR